MDEYGMKVPDKAMQRAMQEKFFQREVERIKGFLQRNPQAHPKFLAAIIKQEEAEAQKIINQHMLRPPITRRSPRWR